MVHCFDTDVAKQYGILEAVLINHFLFWLEKNRTNGINFHDGDYWTYNSTAAFQKQFPYVSKRQIERALQHLRDEEIIKTANYNEFKYDRTLWYAFTEKGKCISRFGEMEVTKKGNGNPGAVEPIPDTNPNTNSNNVTHNGGAHESADEKKPDLKPSAFEQWWSHYPRKVGKTVARKAFEKVKVPLEVLVGAVEAQKQSEQWTKEDGRFIPNPATWLNQGRWEDELPKLKYSNGGERGLDVDELAYIKRIMEEN